MLADDAVKQMQKPLPIACRKENDLRIISKYIGLDHPDLGGIKGGIVAEADRELLALGMVGDVKVDVWLRKLLNHIVKAVRDTGADESDLSLVAKVVGAVVIIGKKTSLDIDEQVVIDDAALHVTADGNDRVNRLTNIGIDLVNGKIFHIDAPVQEMLNLYQELIFTL